jgi:hypothetical protein
MRHLIGARFSSKRISMRSPPPRITGSGGAGLTLVTWVIDKLIPGGIPQPLLYVLLIIGIGAMLWAVGSGFVLALRHTRSQGTSMVPVVGMAVTGILFVAFGIWYFIQNYKPTVRIALDSALSAKGGDASGSGGAGGGGLNSPGGNSTGTGGAGGGGSMLGGGGGGGGQGGQGGAGGLGAGGGGGGEGAPGGPGGSGAVVITAHVTEPGRVPKTLHELYGYDYRESGFAGMGELITATLDGPVKTEVRLSWGANCGPTSLWFYIFATKHGYEVVEQLLSIYREVLVSLDMQRKLPLQAGCQAPHTSSPESRFTGKIFVYSEADLPEAKIRSLQDVYQKNKLSLEIRDFEYLKKAPIASGENPPRERDIVEMAVGAEARKP